MGIPVDRVKSAGRGIGRTAGRRAVILLCRHAPNEGMVGLDGRRLVIQKCKQMGFHVEPIVIIEDKSARPLRWTFLVNGHRVAVAGFSVWGEAQDGVVCVLATEEVRTRGLPNCPYPENVLRLSQWLLEGVKDAYFTTGCARPMSRRKNVVRPDYQKYRDAWHLLKSTSATNRRVPGMTRTENGELSALR